MTLVGLGRFPHRDLSRFKCHSPLISFTSAAYRAVPNPARTRTTARLFSAILPDRSIWACAPSPYYRSMVQPEPAWRFEHSVHCAVPVNFAWKFWTDVDNWRLDPDVEAIELDGPFALGTHGRTRSKS